jgi:TonB family protein
MKSWKYWIATAALSWSLIGADVRVLRVPSMPASKIVTKVQPVYPPDAADHGIQGVVKMTIYIGQDGRVENARLISGHPLLTPAARQAVRKWVFEPTLVEGKPVRVVTEVDIPFNLDAYGRPVELKTNSGSQL